MRLRFLWDGWYSWPLVLCRTCRKGENTGESVEGMRLKRVRRLGSDRNREDVGVAEGSMGLNGVRDEAKETEVAARGTAVERVGGRESRRASEGGIRGILSRSVRPLFSTRVK